MGKLSKRKRLREKRMRQEGDEESEEENDMVMMEQGGGAFGHQKQQQQHGSSYLDDDASGDDDEEMGEHEDDDDDMQQQQQQRHAMMMSQRRQPRITKTIEDNIRDMEYLEMAKLEREKRKDKTFQQQRRLAALQRKRALELEHDESMAEEHDDDDDDEGHPSSSSARRGKKAQQSQRQQFEDVAEESAETFAGAGKAITSSAMFSHPALELDLLLVDALARCSFTNLTMIQERVLPFAVQGYDVLGQARTGSGKTLAFCVPMLQGILSSATATSSGKVKGCLGLILAPTKELAHQINMVLTSVVQQFAAIHQQDPSPQSQLASTITNELVTGGTKITEERNRLLRANIVVGTPGRIADHVKNAAQWNLNLLQFFVLDEVDRMLHEGFAVAVDAIIAALPASRQTLLFSATSGKAVGSLARLALSKTPLLISEKLDRPRFLKDEDREVLGDLSYVIGDDNSAAAASAAGTAAADNDNDDGDSKKKAKGKNGAASNSSKEENTNASPASASPSVAGNVPQTLDQYAQFVNTQDRLRALYVFVKKVAKTQKAIVFCATVASATFHCMMMGACGFHEEVLMLHGKMKHRQRLQVFQAFQDWTSGILFCTDVAARGLDIPQVAWVLQLDPPVDPTEYIHRIGRTARAGAAGRSLIFLRPEEKGFLDYARRFGLSISLMAAPKLPDIQHRLQQVLELDPLVARAADHAYSATIGAYESHVLKTIFDPATLFLRDLATAFALPHVPLKGIKKMDVDETFEEDAVGGFADDLTVASRHQHLGGAPGTTGGGDPSKQDYVKGRFSSLHRRRMQAVAKYHRSKTKKQWTDDGKFVGMSKPSTKL